MMNKLAKVFLLMLLALPLMGFHDDRAEFFVLLAEDAQVKGDPDLALEYLGKAIEADPRCTKAYQSRGFYYLQRGRTELALRDFSRLIELNPQEPANYLTRGMALSQSGAGELAAADFRKGCDLGDPGACGFLKELAAGSANPPTDAR